MKVDKSGFVKLVLTGVILWSLGTFIFLVPGCTHDPIIAPGGDTIPSIPVDTTKITTPADTTKTTTPKDTIKTVTCDTSKIYFNRDILPIFIGSCAIAGCHDARTKESGYNLTNYGSIISRGLTSGKPSSSKVYTEMANKSMPPRPYNAIDAASLAKINRWITEGLKNDSCTVTNNACDTTKISYKTDIQPFLTTSCVSCHGSGLSYGGYRFDSYSGTKNAVGTGRLLGALNWQSGYTSMPQGQSKLAQCDIHKIEAWINKGTPNN